MEHEILLYTRILWLGQLLQKIVNNTDERYTHLLQTGISKEGCRHFLAEFLSHNYLTMRLGKNTWYTAVVVVVEEIKIWQPPPHKFTSRPVKQQRKPRWKHSSTLRIMKSVSEHVENILAV